jgi:hypothetical protein
LLPLLLHPLLVISIHCTQCHHLPLTISQLPHGLGKGKQQRSFLLQQLTLLITMSTAVVPARLSLVVDVKDAPSVAPT